MGLRLFKLLQTSGARVRLLVMELDPELGRIQNSGAQIFKGDVTHPNSLNNALEGVNCVIHMAAVLLSAFNPKIYQEVNYQGTVNMLEASEKAGVQHFIFISSASVTYSLSNAYSRSKQMAEQAVKNWSGNYTIIRPTLAYNKTGAEEFNRFFNYVKQASLLFLPAGGVAKKSPVHIDDILVGLVNVPANPICYGKVYNFSGGESYSLKQLAQIFLKELGLSKKIIPVPVWAAKLLVRIIEAMQPVVKFNTNINWQTLSGLIQDADLDNSLAKKELGYNPRSFEKSLLELDLKNRGL